MRKYFCGNKVKGKYILYELLTPIYDIPFPFKYMSSQDCFLFSSCHAVPCLFAFFNRLKIRMDEH